MSKAFTPNFGSVTITAGINQTSGTGGTITITTGTSGFINLKDNTVYNTTKVESWLPNIPINCINCGSNCITNRKCEHCGSKY